MAFDFHLPKSDAGNLGSGTVLRFTPRPIFNLLKLLNSGMNITVNVEHVLFLPCKTKHALLPQRWKGKYPAGAQCPLNVTKRGHLLRIPNRK